MKVERNVLIEFDTGPNAIVVPSSGSWAIEPVVESAYGITIIRAIRVVTLTPVAETVEAHR